MTIGAGQDVEIAISGDGKRLAFSILRQNADIWRLPVSPDTGLVDGKPEEVITTTREDSRGAWSPDGKMIAFNSDRTGEMNIWLHSIEERRSGQLTKGPGGDFQANWSPDGKRILFFSSRSGTADIWCVDVGSGELEQLTSTDAVNVNPFYSPDGKMIAFNSDETGRPEIWVMKADGSEPRQLCDTGVMGHFMRWSRGSDAIIFRSPGGGKPQTVCVDLNVSMQGLCLKLWAAHICLSLRTIRGSWTWSATRRYGFRRSIWASRKRFLSLTIRMCGSIIRSGRRMDTGYYSIVLNRGAEIFG
jgi:Tol biopolymer transport system component